MTHSVASSTFEPRQEQALASVSPTAASDDEELAAAEVIAAQLAIAATAFETRADARRRRRVAAVVADQASREFLSDLTDQVLRIGSQRRAARRFHDLIGERGVPKFAHGLDRLALVAAGRFAPLLPGAVMPIATARLRREFAAVVLPAERLALSRHIERRRAEGIRLNVNLLGEAVLGEAEARARTDMVIDLLDRPGVDYISVKISSICAQLDVLAYENSLGRILDRLREIYRAAAMSSPAKFVNLDMEEYRDLHLTIDAFTTLLAEPEFVGLDAGIVLQAYLPDSYAALERIAAFARQRHERHGSAVKVRIVKGANLAMERVEAELRGWEQAPFLEKREVDANFKRLVDLALRPENAGALRLGVASHNLFDVAWALVQRETHEASDRVEIEMLEGMANPQALAASREAHGLLLYAPIVRRDDFASAVAYLVRRFDENTSPENFLSHVFDLSPGSPFWDGERDRFRTAVAERLLLPGAPRRRQDRASERAAPGASARDGFVNEPDTDFTLETNRAWLNGHLAKWAAPIAGEVPAIVDGEAVLGPCTGIGIDPSEREATLYRYVEADRETVDRAVTTAVRAGRSWSSLEPTERRRLLYRVADTLASGRGETIAVMAHDAGKTIAEGDPEVSEAIDFARYYGDRALELSGRDDAAVFEPYRVVVVAPPWNFPLAIPAGGVFAALAAGAAVILKPAPETVLTAWTLAQQCWEAGVPRDVLQFVPTADDEVGRRLITHEDVDAVILTGAYETARLFLGWRPALSLHAETNGKNSLIITAAADQDDAIADLIRSAFSHAGQKCSAASLAIVEAAVHDDPRFLARLADAVTSLRVGGAADPASQVGPLVRPPSGALARFLTELAPGERWLVQPQQVGDNPRLWRPGVKVGVRPGSEFHLTECFGPVLGIMRAADLGDAIALQNAPAYGLTGGIHTLDEQEITRWLERVEVGNAYVNRHTTGAIVQRQPFGGWKRSSIGTGAKAGGPHYVASLGAWHPPAAADVESEIERAKAYWLRLSVGEDPSGLRAERNAFRLRRLPNVSVRLGSSPDPTGLAVALGIARLVGVSLDLSADAAYSGLPDSVRIESDADFLARLKGLAVDRVRLVGAPPDLRLRVLDAGFDADVEQFVGVGAFELLRWTREQSISETMHRHGNVRAARR
jgi:RHH-type transcriptional regulator, proline utilization regulon repressor / proline dehydrogenase / delta 1-pyrroline-5-carboxylate dehydrogenase